MGCAQWKTRILRGSKGAGIVERIKTDDWSVLRYNDRIKAVDTQRRDKKNIVDFLVIGLTRVQPKESGWLASCELDRSQQYRCRHCR